MVALKRNKMGKYVKMNDLCDKKSDRKSTKRSQIFEVKADGLDLTKGCHIVFKFDRQEKLFSFTITRPFCVNCLSCFFSLSFPQEIRSPDFCVRKKVPHGILVRGKKANKLTNNLRNIPKINHIRLNRVVLFLFLSSDDCA